MVLMVSVLVTTSLQMWYGVWRSDLAWYASGMAPLRYHSPFWGQRNSFVLIACTSLGWLRSASG